MNLRRAWDFFKDKIFGPTATGFANAFLGAPNIVQHLTITIIGNIDNFRSQ